MAKKQAFRNLDAEYAKAFKNGNATAVAALYTTDAQFLVPNGTTMKGRKGIEKVTMESLAAGWKNLKFSGQRGGSAGDIAYNVGKLLVDIPTANGTRQEKGKFVDIYKRQKDGSWKIAITIYNSDLPQS